MRSRAFCAPGCGVLTLQDLEEGTLCRSLSAVLVLFGLMLSMTAGAQDRTEYFVDVDCDLDLDIVTGNGFLERDPQNSQSALNIGKDLYKVHRVEPRIVTVWVCGRV